MDNEIKGEGNSINYKYRMHDPRVGRFFATDLAMGRFPWNSAYSFSENRVIDGVELEGLEVSLINAKFEEDGRASGSYDPGYPRAVNDAQIINSQASSTLFKLGFDSELPKKFIDLYTGSQGGTYHLSDREAEAIAPARVGIRGGLFADTKKKEETAFEKELSSLGLGESKNVKFEILGGARSSGTLGGFTITFKGLLTKDSDDPKKWVFEGTMDFYDEWDFDLDVNGDKVRSISGEMLTEIGNKYLKGKKFAIRSYTFDVKQTSEDRYVDWFDGKKFKPTSNKLFDAMRKNPKIREALKKRDFKTALKEYLKDQVKESANDIKEKAIPE